MNFFWQFEDASLAEAREAQTRAAAAESSWAETGAPFLTQVEQVLGEEAVPDSEFFIDSWTVGTAAASENLLRRQARSREHQIPSWTTFSSFTPWFVPRAEATFEAAWPNRDKEISRAYARCNGDEQRDDRQAEEEVEIAGPLTLESACRALGVAPESTREQIRAAYRQMAGRYHPDRLARSGAREQKQASDRMALINVAYRMLCTVEAGREYSTR